MLRDEEYDDGDEYYDENEGKSYEKFISINWFNNDKQMKKKIR